MVETEDNIGGAVVHSGRGIVGGPEHTKRRGMESRSKGIKEQKENGQR